LTSNQPAHYIQAVSNDAFHSRTAVNYMRDLMSMTATTATRTELRSASGLSYRNQGSEHSSVNVLSAIPDLLRGTRYLSTCRQLLTLKLSSVYLKLTYLLPLTNYLIAFIVHLTMTMLCLLDYRVSGHERDKILLYVCMYVFVNPFVCNLPLPLLPHSFQSRST